MSPNTRTALLAIAIALSMLVAGSIGYAIGRGSIDEPVAAATTTSAASAAAATPAASISPSPSPASAVAISASGAVLRRAPPDQISPGAATTACESLITPGLTGECGDVRQAAGRVVWIVERSAVANGVSGFRVRILTYSPSEGGWVERLSADDLQGRRWASVAVLPADLTRDGVPELLVGFRGLADREPLELDVVGYGQDGAVEVIAHPDRADQGAVVVNAAGQLLEYAARYAAGEAACCPGSFEQRTIISEGGLLRQVATQTVAPTQVPASQL
jgi:hypothetical protein